PLSFIVGNLPESARRDWKRVPTEPILTETPVGGKANLASSVIAFGVVLAICYFAASVIEVLLVSILLAIFLDPIAELFCRVHLPRALGAFFAVLILVGVVVVASVFLYTRVEGFAEDLPRY